MFGLSKRAQIYILAGLLVVFVLTVWLNRTQAPALTGVVAANQRFQPLQVEDPTLRMDLLDRIHKQEYTGTHRNIFSSEPPPPPASEMKKALSPPVPVVPAGPPPLEVPATFFGYLTNPKTGRRQAFFTSGEDVFVVDEGGMLLNRFRLLKVGNNSVDLEEISSGRRATLTLELPPPGQQLPGQQFPPQQQPIPPSQDPPPREYR
jgi:hypothetical protein